MKKYALVTINFKELDENKLAVRRVLISYRRYKAGTFYGTRYIAADPYFKRPEASHTYIFKDKYYILCEGSAVDSSEAPLVGEKRAYHFNKFNAIMMGHEKELEPILFKAEDTAEAIKIFIEEITYDRQKKI